MKGDILKMFLHLITDKALNKLIEREVKINDKEWKKFIDNEVMTEIRKATKRGFEEGQKRLIPEIEKAEKIILEYQAMVKDIIEK